MPVYNGYLTDIQGVLVGHYTDEINKTGCTVIVVPKGAIVGSDVRGGAPGTREIALTKPCQTVQKAHAICLSGGSAYGLAAASGVMNYLESVDIGLATPAGIVPIVAGAVIYDLAYGNSKVRPTEQNGYQAAQSASAHECRQGNIGAGTGATIGKYLGFEHQQKGGLGSASVTLANGTIVSALVVVNAIGDIYNEQGQIIAGAHKNGKFIDTVAAMLAGVSDSAQFGTNTTIGVIATNAKLNKEEVNKVATVAHNGYALAIRPVHTSLDGDTIFALSCGEQQAKLDEVCVAAQIAMQRAIINAVLAAKE